MTLKLKVVIIILAVSPLAENYSNETEGHYLKPKEPRYL